MRRVLLPLVVMITSLAHAHVSPSVDDNNRYLKVSPQADRVRVAYTVFFGEVPGAALRPALDTNRDGAISDGEAQAFGDRIAADVIGALDLNLDGKQLRVRWKAVTVGMGSPTVAAGSFSIDMIAYVCLTRARGRHELLLKDSYRVPKPGETEVRVEDGPGITVEHARIGGSDALANDFKFVGPGGPLSDDGLRVAFVASDKAPLSNECDALEATNADRIPWLAIALGVLAIVLGVVLVIHKRRK
jgi:hypothetical protein